METKRPSDFFLFDSVSIQLSIISTRAFPLFILFSIFSTSVLPFNLESFFYAKPFEIEIR